MKMIFSVSGESNALQRVALVFYAVYLFFRVAIGVMIP